jgi:peptidoglycan biosynthesis protein MviN/MurJ (putative lipid II flippase)
VQDEQKAKQERFFALSDALIVAAFGVALDYLLVYVGKMVGFVLASVVVVGVVGFVILRFRQLQGKPTRAWSIPRIVSGPLALAPAAALLPLLRVQQIPFVLAGIVLLGVLVATWIDRHRQKRRKLPSEKATH